MSEEMKTEPLVDGQGPQNYLIEFDGEGISARVIVDNKTDCNTVIYDYAEDQEEIMFLFAMLTEKNDDGDLKLAKMCAAIRAAGLHHHTYDLKSGAEMRQTRIGVTMSRLKKFAAATDHIIGFDKTAIEQACRSIDLVLENPPGKDWYPPYDHLSGPYDLRKPQLYEPFSEGDCVKIMRLIITGNPNFTNDAKGCGFDIDKLESDEGDNKFCRGISPIHNSALKDALEHKWMHSGMPWNLPVFDIKEYFGEEVGFYFAFLGHLTTGIFYLVPFGVGAQALSFYGNSQGWTGQWPEACFAIWSTSVISVILDSWRFKQNRTAHLWRSFGCQNSLPPRPGFKGVVLKNPISGKLEIEYPESLRSPKAVASMFMSSTMVVVLLATIVSIFIYRSLLSGGNPSAWKLIVPCFMNAIQMTIFGVIYENVAVFMTDLENHKTIVEHNTALFQKLTFFYFINYYVTLFYIAFIKGSVEGCYAPLAKTSFCGHELAFQVAIVFFVNDFCWRMCTSVGIPYIVRIQNRVKAETDPHVKLELMGEIEKQFLLMEKYDPAADLIMDYAELYVQFGFLTLFGAAFPFTAAFGFITDFVETRTDGYKLFHDFRRVLPNRVDGVGSVLDVFYYILYISVPVNAGLIVFTFGSVDFLPQNLQVWIFVGIIIFIFTLLYILDWLYPDVPEKTEIQLERQQAVYERVILDTKDVDGDLVLDLDSSMIGKSVTDVLKSISQNMEKQKPNMTTTICEHAPLEYLSYITAKDENA